MAETFEEFVGRERARLHAEREAVFTQQQELEGQLAKLNNELKAIDAYESAKTAKSAPARSGRKPGSSQGTRAARSGSRREEILATIRQHGAMGRGDLLEKMGLKGNKAGEMSVSNALTALTKSNTLVRAEGKYAYPG